MPNYAYADPTGQYRRWYPNITQVWSEVKQKVVRKGVGYWGRPGSDIKGSRGGGSYSRHRTEGKGLPDTGQQAYSTLKRSGLSTGYDRYLFDVEQMLYTHPKTGQQTYKGMYQLPKSPKYAGGVGSFEAPTAAQQIVNVQAYRKQINSAERQANATANQYGGITTGRRQGYPPWVMQMLGKSALGKPPKTTGSPSLPIGLALVALKVLL